MLYFVLVWVILLVVSSVIGTAILRGLRVECFDRMGDRAIIALWLGILMFAIALLITSWVFPLSPLHGATLAILLCGLSFKIARTDVLRLWRAIFPKLIPALLTLMIGVAAFTLRPATWMDSGYYHAQAIQWLAEFGAVPGLALFFDHLGFTSSWFALAAPLNPNFLQGSALVITNGFALLLIVLQCFVGLAHIYRHKARLCDWFSICFLTIPVLIIVKFHHVLAEIFISPSPDIPVLFVTGAIAWTMIAISDSDQRDLPKNRIVPFILAGGALGLKLVALPLLLVTSLFYLSSKKIKPIHGLLSIVILIGGMAPVLIHGVITSGCPIYPSTTACLDLPWTPDPAAVSQIATRTHQWATLAQAPPSNPIVWTQQQWQWMHKHVGNPKIAIALIAASGVSCLSLFMLRKRHSMPGWQWLVFMAMTGIGFFLKTSPMMRFWLTYLTLLPIFLLALYCHLQPDEWRLTKRRVGPVIPRIPQVSLTLPLFLAAVILLSYSHTHSPMQMLLPPARSSVATTSITVNEMVLSVPKQGVHCWATAIPCVPNPRLPNQARLRDPSRGFGAGFVRLNHQPRSH